MNWFASRSIHHVAGVAALSLCLLLAACGGSDSSNPTPTATTKVEQAVETQAPQPTTPPISTPAVTATDVATSAPLAVATPTGETVSVATPAETTAASPVAEETAQATTETSVAATPRSEGMTSDNPGDGTGGSGMTERNESRPEEATAVAATPAASPVAQLSIEGCDVPDVPTYSGPNTEVTLTSDVNFRSGPGTDCDPLTDAPLGEGQTVTVTGGPVTQTADNSEWIEVEVNGQKGWISTEFVEPAE